MGSPTSVKSTNSSSNFQVSSSMPWRHKIWLKLPLPINKQVSSWRNSKCLPVMETLSRKDYRLWCSKMTWDWRGHSKIWCKHRLVYSTIITSHTIVKLCHRRWKIWMHCLMNEKYNSKKRLQQTSDAKLKSSMLCIFREKNRRGSKCSKMRQKVADFWLMLT